MNELQTNPSYQLINKDSLLNLSNELALLIKEKGLSSNIQGKQFVNVEGWGYAGAAIGLIPIITKVENLSTETEIKYLAVCEVRNIAQIKKGQSVLLMSMQFYQWHKLEQKERLTGCF